MSRWSLAVVVVVATALAIAAAAWALFLRGGVSAKPDPPRLETELARHARSLLVPTSARDLRNPLPATAEVLAEGRAHFADHCASCHANDGGGDTPLGRGLYPRAPDMRRTATQQLTDGELFWIIENGVRFTGMPAWGEPGRESESWELVHFIRRLPGLTAEEKLLMERLNPRGPEAWREMEEDEKFLRGEEPAPARPRHAH